MSRLLKGYIRLVHTHPLKTQTITSGVLMGTGNVIYQVAFEKRLKIKDYQFHRTASCVAVGLCIGPILGTWFRFLEKTFPVTPVNLLKKFALDQTLAAPTILFGILSGITFTTTFSLEKTKIKLQNDYFPTLINSYKLWPAVQIINLYFVPLNYRVLVVNVVALFWNTYIAYMTSY